MDPVTTNIDVIIDLVTAVMSLFTIFPLNIFIAGSLAGIALNVFGKSKRVTKS